MNTYFCHLADRLRFNDTDAIESCIKFIEEDTKGAQHGRARALMCRRLKHCTLDLLHKSLIAPSHPIGGGL